jgi:hypothetical protein
MCIRDETAALDSYLNSKLEVNSYTITKKLENKKLKTIKNNLHLENCTPEFFKGSMRVIYNHKDFDGCKCLNLTNQNEHIKIRSKFNMVEGEIIKYEITTKNNINWSEFNNYLTNSNSKLFLYFPTYNVDKYNLQDPLKKILNIEAYDIRPYVQQSIDVSISKLNFTDYSSIYNKGI